MNNNSNDALLVIIAIAVALFFIIVWKFSNYLGAEFKITLSAMIYSLVALVITAGIWWFTRSYTGALIFGYVAVTWPKWWSVLSSAASGGASKDDIFFAPFQNPWWNTELFKYGIEGALVIATIFFVYKHISNPYA